MDKKLFEKRLLVPYFFSAAPAVCVVSDPKQKNLNKEQKVSKN